jgi:preprotein translocase subunit YajC
VQGGGFLIFLVAMFAIMYFLVIRPQKNKQRAVQDMLSRVGPGDEIITIGGIYGDVIEVADDRVVLEIAEDVHIEVARKAISQVVPQETFGEDAVEAEGDVIDQDALGEADGHPELAREEKRFGVFGRRSG